MTKEERKYITQLESEHTQDVAVIADLTQKLLAFQDLLGSLHTSPKLIKLINSGRKHRGY